MEIDPDPGVSPGGTGDPTSFRFRRRHQKSRRGCLECKRRHMKCDETRPRCLNCATVERTCSYKGVGGTELILPSSVPLFQLTDADVVSRASSSGAENIKSLGIEEEGPDPRSQSPASMFGAAPAACHPPLVDSSQAGAPPRLNSSQTELHPQQNLPYHHHYHPEEEEEKDEAHVNMVHMELFHHFLSSTYGFVFPEQTISRLVKEVAVRNAVTTPFLMHQLLAFAARHRSSVDTDGRGPYFRHLATQLQTRAISLFGRVDLHTVTPSERVSIFIFSSFLGFQDLCDALSLRAASFDVWMERYLGYVRLHRGVHKVIEGSWELLRVSELRPILDAGEEMYNASGTGNECDDLRERIEASGSLGEGGKEACRFAIRHLQWVFDSKPNFRSRVNVLLAWVAMYPEGFLKLLEAGCKEALCVLGYYFVILHFVKDVWFVSDSGEWLMKLLNEHLGPEWEDWMARPNELMEENWG